MSIIFKISIQRPNSFFNINSTSLSSFAVPVTEIWTSVSGCQIFKNVEVSSTANYPSSYGGKVTIIIYVYGAKQIECILIKFITTAQH